MILCLTSQETQSEGCALQFYLHASCSEHIEKLPLTTKHFHSWLSPWWFCLHIHVWHHGGPAPNWPWHVRYLILLFAITTVTSHTSWPWLGRHLWCLCGHMSFTCQTRLTNGNLAICTKPWHIGYIGLITTLRHIMMKTGVKGLNANRSIVCTWC